MAKIKNPFDAAKFIPELGRVLEAGEEIEADEAVAREVLKHGLMAMDDELAQGEREHVSADVLPRSQSSQNTFEERPAQQKANAQAAEARERALGNAEDDKDQAKQSGSNKANNKK